jgi:hypothetical protein
VNSIRKTGLKPLMEIIEESEEGASCDAAERKWIAEMKSRGYRLINFTDGGEHGYKMSDEVKKANSARQKGIKRGPMSAENKAKISAANKGIQFNPNSGTNFSALNRSRRGIPLSDETKKKLSEIGKGFVTGKWRENVIRANQNRKHASKFTDEQKAEIKFLIADGYSHKVIAGKYGMSIGTVSCIKRDQMWCDIGIADSVPNPPEFKSVPLYRNDKGQYKRAA